MRSTRLLAPIIVGIVISTFAVVVALAAVGEISTVAGNGV